MTQVFFMTSAFFSFLFTYKGSLYNIEKVSFKKEEKKRKIIIIQEQHCLFIYVCQKTKNED